jgi:hypothetical protein
MPRAAHLGSRDHYIENTDPGGEIGRRSGLKTRGYTACGFESRPGYQPPSRASRLAAVANGIEQNRNSMKALTGIIVVALAACSTPSEIVKTGPNAYRVRTSAGGGSPSDSEIKTRGIARANEFCDGQGQRAVINIGQSSGWHLFSVQTAEVQFFCDDKLPQRQASASPATSLAASALPAPSTSAAPARPASASSPP